MSAGSASKRPPRSTSPALPNECIRVAGERSLDQRQRALSHRLLVEADQQGFPPELLPGPVAEVEKQDWHKKYEESLNDALTHVERQWSRRRRPRARLQASVVFLTNVVPELTLVGGILVMLYRFNGRQDLPWSVVAILTPFLLTLVVLILFHLLVNWVLPLRWPSIPRGVQTSFGKAGRGTAYRRVRPVAGRIERSVGRRAGAKLANCWTRPMKSTSTWIANNRPLTSKASTATEEPMTDPQPDIGGKQVAG